LRSIDGPRGGAALRPHAFPEHVLQPALWTRDAAGSGGPLFLSRRPRPEAAGAARLSGGSDRPDLRAGGCSLPAWPERTRGREGGNPQQPVPVEHAAGDDLFPALELRWPGGFDGRREISLRAAAGWHSIS